MNKRYAVYPGFIHSKSDGKEHYIGARQLMNLYGVAACDCVVVLPHERLFGAKRLVALFPRSSGNYSLNNGTVRQDNT